jgi:hypothetical protein
MMKQTVAIRAEFRMRALVSHLMTVVLLIHAVVGCCWHHQHRCGTNCRSEVTAAQGTCPCEEHQHETTLAHIQPGDVDRAGCDESRHEHGCDGDRCSFVRSERSPVQSGKPYPDTLVHTWACFGNSAGPNSLFCTGCVGHSAIGPATALRLHLALGILLI